MESQDEKRKYKHMENVLNYVMSNYISLNDEECKKNNVILNEVINMIVSKMKEKDELFKLLYRRVFYGGSYYDGLKVGRPEEYDLDLLFSLPKLTNPQLTAGSLPGYLKVQLPNLDAILQQRNSLDKFYLNFKALVDDEKYIIPEKVYSWMQGVITSAFNDFKENNNHEREISIKEATYYFKVTRSGPALTLNIWNNDGERMNKIDVDLVPCFVFGKDSLPIELGNNRAKLFGSEGTKGEFFVVPKPVKSDNKDNKTYRLWRLSFQEQEKSLISGKNTLKSSLRLLKKLRDFQNHKSIASYYLKTVYLWEVENNKEEGFWRRPLCCVFLHMLKMYQQCLGQNMIPYYWNKSNNLIKHISPDTINNIKQRVCKVVMDIEQNYNDRYVMIKYFLTAEECEDVKKAIPLPIKSSIAICTRAPLLKAEIQNSTVNPQTVEPQSFQCGDNSDKEKLDNILSYLKIIESQNSKILTEVKQMKQKIEMLERKQNEE